MSLPCHQWWHSALLPPSLLVAWGHHFSRDPWLFFDCLELLLPLSPICEWKGWIDLAGETWGIENLVHLSLTWVCYCKFTHPFWRQNHFLFFLLLLKWFQKFLWVLTCQFGLFNFAKRILLCLSSVSVFIFCSLFFPLSSVHGFLHWNSVRISQFGQAALLICRVQGWSFLVLRRTWPWRQPQSFRAHRMPPTSSLQQASSAFLKFRVCALLLAFLMLLRSLNSAGYWRKPKGILLHVGQNG